jgi:phage anti-repressor protein
MSNLIVIENGLIRVYKNNENGQVVNARELHEFLEVGKDFTTWIKDRIDKYDFVEDTDFIVFTENGENLSNGGRPKTEYILTLDTAKEIAMVQNNEKGKQVRKYFILIEKKYKEQNKPVCIEDVLIKSLQEMKDVKLQLQEVKQSTADNKQEIQGIRDVVALNPNQWRKDTAELINKMAASLGGFEHIKPIREESYKMLDENMGVCLKTRVLNKKKKMALEGTPKYKIDKINPLDAIADDKKLINGYVSIITKLAIKYKVA